MIYGNSNNSTAQKAVVLIIETAVLIVAVWLLLFGGLETISRLLHVQWAKAVPARRELLVAGYCVIYLRIIITMCFLLKRSIGWQEAVSIPLAFALYYWGYSLLAGPTSGPIGAIEYVGVALFLGGSFLNTGSESLRDRWKKVPTNKGKLYTGGLFRYSMHINYFGDILWVAGLAMITANPWSTFIPILIFIFFAFYNAPILDKHLLEKYGNEFVEYKARTKRLVPFIW